MGMRIEMWKRRAVAIVAGLGMLVAMTTVGAARAQAQEPMVNAEGSIPAGETYAVILLRNVKSERGGGDLATALRNVLTRAHIYYAHTQHAIAIRGADADVEAARKMLAELDKPQTAYRLVYTITVRDGGKTVDTRHFALLLDASGRAEVKQGSRVPVAAGTIGAKSGTSAQVQYLDVGLRIQAELDGAQLCSTVDETRLSGNKSVMGAADPVFEQAVLNGETPLPVGKPLVLGTLDMPNSTRQEVVEVTAEPVE